VTPSGRLLVVCKDDQTLDVVDLASGTTEGRIRASGYTPHEVAATPDGRFAYLPIYSDAWLGDPGTDGQTIDVIDLVDLRVTDTISLDRPSRPHLPVVGPDGLVYISAELDESVSVVDPGLRVPVGRLPTARPQSHMFVLAPDGSRVYTANVESGSVSVVDVASQSLVDVIAVSGTINRISIAPDGSTVFTADQDAPRLAAIDVRTRAITWIDLPSRGFGTAVTPDGRYVVVALRWASQVGIVDLADAAAVRVADVPSQPQAIVIHPSGGYAYSACDADRQVVEVDLTTAEVSRTFGTGRGADGVCWARRPIS
jgi:YVTN family beta-propeller protein